MKLGLVVVLALLMSNALSNEVAILDKIKKSLPHLTIVDISLSPVDGIYEVQVEQGQTFLYATANGNYLFAGDLYRLDDGDLVNLAELRRVEWRRYLFSMVDTNDLIVFAPKENTEVIVYVFTDVDCPYCRAIHEDIVRLNRYGIEVRYLAFPIDGVGSSNYERMVSAWCSENPKLAITDLKRSKEIPPATCENPVAEHYELGKQFGVVGTPVLVTLNGDWIEGYLGPDELADKLNVSRQAESSAN